MRDAEKLNMVKTMMYIDTTDDDAAISAYIRAAEREIINWRYSLAKTKPESVPEEYEMVQVFAVIAGFSQVGAEGQTKHSEGSIERIFKYDTMVDYIRAHVLPIVGCYG